MLEKFIHIKKKKRKVQKKNNFASSVKKKSTMTFLVITLENIEELYDGKGTKTIQNLQFEIF